jgi:hypothetical protein
MKEEVHRGALVNDTTVYAALAIIMMRIFLLLMFCNFFFCCWDGAGNSMDRGQE